MCCFLTPTQGEGGCNISILQVVLAQGFAFLNSRDGTVSLMPTLASTPVLFFPLELRWSIQLATGQGIQGHAQQVHPSTMAAYQACPQSSPEVRYENQSTFSVLAHTFHDDFIPHNTLIYCWYITYKQNICLEHLLVV